MMTVRPAGTCPTQDPCCIQDQCFNQNQGSTPAARLDTADASGRLGQSPIACRPGYSLIEVLLAVAIISMVLTAVAVAMRTMYRVDRQLKDNAAYEQVVPRLALQLRTDVHAASDVAAMDAADESSGVALTLATGGDVVEYHSAAGRVTRTRRRGQEELGREVYSLGKHVSFRWRMIAAPTPMLELEIARAMGKIEAPDARQVDRVVAATGIRVTRPEEGAGDASDE